MQGRYRVRLHMLLQMYLRDHLEFAKLLKYSCTLHVSTYGLVLV